MLSGLLNQIASLGADARLKGQDIVALSVVVDSKQEWDKAVSQMPELAQATETDPREAQRLLNALSLMGILRVSMESATPLIRTRQTSAPAQAEPTLFQRLRKRLGL